MESEACEKHECWLMGAELLQSGPKVAGERE